MKILIFGKGYLGTRFAAAWPGAVLSDVWIDDKTSVLKALDEHKPDAVVNAAGTTGNPNVDWCETHQAETARGNVIGPLILAEACQERSVYLLHLGSGCVFYGTPPDPKGWKEEDFANPEAFYSRSKYAGDLLLSRMPNVGIARLRLPIDHVPSPKNLIDKLSAYKQVIDVANSVTIMDDLLAVLPKIIEKRGTGIFHVVNPGVMRYRDLFALYREYVDPNHTCEWIRDEDLVTRGLTAKRRSTVVLQSTRLAELGIEMRPIEVAMRDTMQKYAAAKRALTNAQPTTEQNPKPFNFLKTHRPIMRGVLAAGGTGTRLAPLTQYTNKHLLPVYNKPMILYPLQTLLDAGIRDIILVTGPDHAHQFMKLLGSGAKYGCRLSYRIQDEAGGIAQVLNFAEDFVGNDNCTMILGDNIFEDNFLPDVSSFQSGAMTFYKHVSDPQRFGVVELDPSGRVLSIEEKPKMPKSNFAQVGLYIYDPTVFEIARSLKPSGRGELEIAEVNSAFLAQGKLIAKPVRGFWTDAGTFASMRKANDFFTNKEGMM